MRATWLNTESKLGCRNGVLIYIKSDVLRRRLSMTSNIRSMSIVAKGLSMDMAVTHFKDILFPSCKNTFNYALLGKPGSGQLKVAKMSGLVGFQKTWNRKETQRRSERRTKLVKNRPSKETQFSAPSKRTGGLTGAKTSLPLEGISFTQLPQYECACIYTVGKYMCACLLVFPYISTLRAQLRIMIFARMIDPTW